MEISELTLERVRQVLKLVRETGDPEFLRKLADITLLLLERGPRIARLNQAQEREFEGELESSADALAKEAGKPALEIDRTEIFWVFFFAAKLRLATAYVGMTFQPVDVELRNFLDAHRSDFIAEEKIRAEYLITGLPRELLTAQFNRLTADLQLSAQTAAASIKVESDRAEKSLQALKDIDERATNLTNLLQERTEKLNFIGLSQGFSRMSDEAESAIRSPLIWLSVCAAAMLLAPITALVVPKVAMFEDYEWWQIAGPILTFELVLFYLFRVLLLRYQSLKAQLLQIKLRFNLCAFIEGYSEFAARIRKSADDKTLDKFESLVFSGISPDPQKVPSQFDGIDQLANLLKALTSSAK